MLKYVANINIIIIYSLHMIPVLSSVWLWSLPSISLLKKDYQTLGQRSFLIFMWFSQKLRSAFPVKKIQITHMLHDTICQHQQFLHPEHNPILRACFYLITKCAMLDAYSWPRVWHLNFTFVNYSFIRQVQCDNRTVSFNWEWAFSRHYEVEQSVQFT